MYGRSGVVGASKNVGAKLASPYAIQLKKTYMKINNYIGFVVED